MDWHGPVHAFVFEGLSGRLTAVQLGCRMVANLLTRGLSRALALSLLCSPAAFALGLGDIRLNSSLNAPLDAEIELIGATPEELANLKAQIASRETFARYGLDFPSYLTSVTLRSARTNDGRDVIKLRSAETMTEPFVTLLVEVDWVRGRLVREYTMLLDPPVFTPGQERVANAPIAAPTTDAAREGAIDRSGIDVNAAKRDLAGGAAAAAAEAAASAGSNIDINAAKADLARNSGGSSESDGSIDINAAKRDLALSDDAGSGDDVETSPAGDAPLAAAAPREPAPSNSFSTPSDGSYRVQRGDTLSGIASRYTGNGINSTSSKRWMVAAFQNNPSAFDGNINIMRTGAVLRVPDESAISSISGAEAAAEVSRQYSAWNGAGGPGGAGGEPRLRLVTPNSAGSLGTAGSENSAEIRQLQGRVTELQSQLDESRRLLELRNSELAQLQARVRQQGAASSAPPPEEAPPAESQAPAEPPLAATEPAEEIAPPAPREDRVRPPAGQAEAESGGSFFDTLKSYWWAIALLLVVILGYMGFKTWRSRQDAEFDDSLGRLAAAGADSLAREPRFDTSPAVLPAGRGEGAFLVEETSERERPRMDGGVAPPPAARSITADDTISSDTAINLDQGDPLAEADFHMAYGLYDQAADLVRIAINREPDRRDLKLKLLEVFFVWGNREQFLQTARDLAQTRDQAAPGEWEKIVIMGKQLAPDDPLFAGGAGYSGAAAGGVDLDLEGGQSRVDFDLLGEPLPQQSDGGIDLDIGTAIGEPEPTMAQAAGTGSLALDDELLREDEVMGGTTRQMTQRMSPDSDSLLGEYGSDNDVAPTVEQPAYRNQDPTIRQKVAMAMKQSGRADQTAELALDDLGLDLNGLDSQDQSSADAPTLVAGLDERSRRLMETAEHRMGNGSAESTQSQNSGSWGFNSEDFDETGASNTARLQALKGTNELDFDIGAFSDEAEPSAASNGRLDLDVGANLSSDTGFTSTQRLSSSDLALPDMEPVTMSEVGTKLDLARAYMDMGDPEGARNILEEVLQEGSVAQKQEAQRLIESLPG
jgi:pilus assembly protein FimV